jgi:predicted PurR-regulated permease PerM
MERSRKLQQNKALNIATVIALLFGAYFLRHFFGLIIFAMIVAFLFNPIYLRLCRKLKRNSRAASLTLIISLLALIVPLILIGIITVYQIKHALDSLSSNSSVSAGAAGQQFKIRWLNSLSGSTRLAEPERKFI